MNWRKLRHVKMATTNRQRYNTNSNVDISIDNRWIMSTPSYYITIKIIGICLIGQLACIS